MIENYPLYSVSQQQQVLRDLNYDVQNLLDHPVLFKICAGQKSRISECPIISHLDYPTIVLSVFSCTNLFGESICVEILWAWTPASSLHTQKRVLLSTTENWAFFYGILNQIDSTSRWWETYIIIDLRQSSNSIIDTEDHRGLSKIKVPFICSYFVILTSTCIPLVSQTWSLGR